MDPSIEPGTTVAGYVIEERIGSGGFGEVYRARHPVIGRTVAIKVLHAKYSSDIVAVTRFISEARAVNQISHPNIVEVFAFGSHEGRELFVMELLAGKTLRAMLDERTRIPLAEAVPLLRGIADAVDAAHAAGIAHRDLKPDNVFVLADGRVKLIDFGIAKLQDDNTPTLTETGSMLGTPQYMSPEQCRGRTVDLRTDQYSFGALAYHVLVGEPPFTGDPIEIALHHLNDRPVPPSKRRKELPPEVDRVVLALLAKDPAQRPATCAAAVAAMTGERTLKLRWSRTTRLRIAAVPIVLAAGVGTAVLWSGRGDDVVVAANACELGVDRVAAVWNPVSRAITAGRLLLDPATHGDSIVGVRDALAELDDTATRWATAWDAACTSPDRAADPLLYGERVTCLENAFLDFRTVAEGLQTLDPPVVVDGIGAMHANGLRGRRLEDCANERVLRAQVPAPPAKARDRIAELLRDGALAQMEVGVAIAKRDTPAVDRGADRVASIARAIEAIDPPSAAALISWRAGMLAFHAFDVDSRRRPAAREALRDGISRIERSGDNVALATALLALAQIELAAGDGDAVAKVGALMPQAEAAVARAGEPSEVHRSLLLVRAVYAMRRGRFEEAIAPLRELASGPVLGYSDDVAPRGVESADVRRLLATAQVAAGRSADALVELRSWFDRARAEYGGDGVPFALQLTYALGLDGAGDLEGALAMRRVSAANVPDPENHRRNPWSRMYLLDLELRLGQHPADASDAIRAIAGLGTTPPLQNPDGPSTARRAGMFEVFAIGIEHASGGDAERIDNAAVLAFQRGDRGEMAKLAAEIVKRCVARTCATRVWRSRWLAVLANPAIAKADADAAFTALEREYTDPSGAVDQFALANSGITLALLGRWTEAKVKLEAARGAPHIWESQSDLSELDAWLGLARVRAGEREGARRVFEESLAVMSIWDNGFDGFCYTAPMVEVALADLVLAEDPARARRLVEHAIKGFARLGRFRERERADAQRWLDQHPAP